MSEEQYKKIMRRRFLIAKLVAGGITTASLVYAGLNMITGIYDFNNAEELSKKLDGKLDEIKTSESYVEYLKTKQDAIYDSFSCGDISMEEYSDKITSLTTDEHIIENVDKFASAEDASEIKGLKEDYDEIGDKTNDKLASAIGTMILGFAPAGAATAVFSKEEDKYR